MSKNHLKNEKGNLAYGSINTSTSGKVIKCTYILAVGAEINSCCSSCPF